ncbi:hypothetical protein EsH8_VIII_001046 [Colletotrichum jinshuiense]
MRLRSTLSTTFTGILATLGATPAQSVPTTRQTTGSLAFLPDEPLLTFQYSTPDPSTINWIGVYHASGGGPDNQEFVEQSLTWAYAPEGEGTLQVSASDLQSGDYRAFFLAKDGYKWLAEPVDLVVPFSSGPVAFVVERLTLHNARQGDEYEAKVGGLRINGGNSTVQFSKIQGDEWITLSADGVLSGTPSFSAQTTKAIVEMTASDGSSARLELTIPMRSAGTPLVEELAVMSFNLWHGGTQVSNYHEKQIRFLVSSGADIVGLQESTGGHATRLGDALGWYSWQGSDVGVISRYPIVEESAHEGYAVYVKIALDGDDRMVNLWNVHLGYDPYGPYDFCFENMTVDQVLEREITSNRTPQIKSVMAGMREQLEKADEMPVLLIGDFNAPSHLDWVEATKKEHCGQGDVPWPTSVEPTQAGMVDSYRKVYQDPAENPGITWSPIFLENEGRSEPMDRIDFVYHKGEILSVVDARALVVGSPKPEPEHGQNEWTSDHAAVLAVYKFSGS